MTPADVTIERTRAGFVLRPETPRGRGWLEANVPGRWEAGALLLEGRPDLTGMVLAMATAGLEVADAPRYYVQAGRKTADGESIN